MSDSINTIQQILINNVSQFDLDSYNRAVNRRLAAVANLGQRYGQEGQGIYLQRVSFRTLLGLEGETRSEYARFTVNRNSESGDVIAEHGIRNEQFSEIALRQNIPDYVFGIILKAAGYVFDGILGDEDKNGVYVCKEIQDVVGNWSDASVNTVRIYVRLDSDADSVYNSVTNEWLRFANPLYIASSDITAVSPEDLVSEQTLFSATFTLAVNAVVDETLDDRDYVCREWGLGMTELGEVLYDGRLAGIAIEGLAGKSSQILAAQAQVEIDSSSTLLDQYSDSDFSVGFIKVQGPGTSWSTPVLDETGTSSPDDPSVVSLPYFDSVGNRILVVDFDNSFTGLGRELSDGDVLYSFVEVYSEGRRIFLCSTVSFFKNGSWERLKVQSPDGDDTVFTLSDLVSTESIENKVLSEIEQYISGSTPRLASDYSSLEYFKTDTIRFADSRCLILKDSQADALLNDLPGNLTLTQRTLEGTRLPQLRIFHNPSGDQEDSSWNTFKGLLFSDRYCPSAFQRPSLYTSGSLPDNTLKYRPELPLVVPENVGVYSPVCVDSAEVLAVGPVFPDETQKEKTGFRLNDPVNGRDLIYRSLDTGQTLSLGAYLKEDGTVRQFSSLEIRNNASFSETPRIDIVTQFSTGLDGWLGDGQSPDSFLNWRIGDSFTGGPGVSMHGSERKARFFASNPEEPEGGDWWTGDWHLGLSDPGRADYVQISGKGLSTARGKVKFRGKENIAQRSRITGCGVRVESPGPENSDLFLEEDFETPAAARKSFAELQHYGIRAGGSFSVVLDADPSRRQTPSVTVARSLVRPAYVQSYSLDSSKTRLKMTLSENPGKFAWRYRPYAESFISLPACALVTVQENPGIYRLASKDKLRECVGESGRKHWNVDIVTDWDSVRTVNLYDAVTQDIVDPEDILFTDRTCDSEEILSKTPDISGITTKRGNRGLYKVYLLNFRYPFSNLIPAFSRSSGLEGVFDFKTYNYLVFNPPYPSDVFSEAVVAATGLKLEPESAEILKGETIHISATVTPASASCKTVLWESASPEVAAVDDDGNVTGVSDGTAAVLATCGSLLASCSVTVKSVPAQSVTVEPGTLTMRVGEQYLLKAAAEPENTTDLVEWSSSNPASVSVNSGGLATALLRGTSEVKARVGSASGTCFVTVRGSDLESLYIVEDELSWDLDARTAHVTARRIPADAEGELAWSVSDPSAASITPSGSDGAVLRAVGSGMTTVEVRCVENPDIRASKEFPVNYVTMYDQDGETELFFLESGQESPENIFFDETR